VSQHDLLSLTQTELVIANPPLETADPPVLRTHTLSVTRELAVADGRGAQLVLCTIEPKDPADPATPAPFQAVAKIYDPLYYSFPHQDVPSVPCDVTRFADEDYSREAAAYEHLQAIGEAGSFAPQYFGSWTLTARLQSHTGKPTTPPPQSRPVRLILIEYIAGPSMRELCAGPSPVPAAALDEGYRLEVLAQIMDAEAVLRLKGLNQRDLAARNIILHNAPPIKSHDRAPVKPSTIPRLVLIDYNISVIESRRIDKTGPCDGGMAATLPQNPMLTYWNNSLQEFRGWIPLTFQSDPRWRRKWLRGRFGGENLAKYFRLEKELVYGGYYQ
jgi:hypothetical protein